MSKLWSKTDSVKSTNLSKLRKSSVGEEIELLKIPEAAEILSISPLTVRKLISEGKLPAVRIGNKSIRVRKSDLREFVENLRAVEKFDAYTE